MMTVTLQLQCTLMVAYRDHMHVVGRHPEETRLTQVD